MPLTFHTTRRVEFRDTDAAGIMHFSVFFNLMEQVEHEFFRDLGTSIVCQNVDGFISWPRAAAHCDYHSPAYFEDILDVTLQVASLGHKSATYDFKFERNGDAIATGRLVAVCCRVVPGQPPRSVVIPDDLRAVLSIE